MKENQKIKKRKEQARNLKKKVVKLKARRKKVREQARNLKKKAVKLKARRKKVRELQKKAPKDGKDFGKFKGWILKTGTEQEKRKIVQRKSEIAKKAARTRTHKNEKRKKLEKEHVLDFIHKHQPISARRIHTKLGFGDKAFGNYLDELLQSKKIHYREKYGWALSNFNFK